MEWIKLLIPLIAVAVWILSHLAKNQQENRRPPLRPLPPPKGDEDGPGTKPRRSPSEVDKFLEEIRRRRDPNQPRKPVVTLQEVAPVVREEKAPDLPRARPVPPPLPPSVPPPLPRRVVPRPEVLPSAQRKRPLVPEEVVLARPAPAPAKEPPPVLPAPGASLGPPAVVTSSRRVSPAVGQLKEMLKDPQSLKVAFLMREILDPPVSRRPRHLGRR